MRYIALLAICLLLPLAPASAAEQEGEHEGHGESHYEEEAEHGEHEFHRHHISIFLGITDGEVEREIHTEEGILRFVEDDEEGTIGLDYEYRLSKRWGVGALVDYAGGDFRTWVWGVAGVWHATRGLKLFVAPGVEHRGGEGEDFLTRLGIMYDFEVGNFTIAPAFNVDIVGREETLVYGVNIGHGF